MAAWGHAIYYQSLEQESILRVEQNSIKLWKENKSRQHHELRLDTSGGSSCHGIWGHVLWENIRCRTVSTFIWGVSNDFLFPLILYSFILICSHHCWKIWREHFHAHIVCTQLHGVNLRDTSHIETIHKGVTFLCPDCKFTTAQKGNLQRHIQSVHEGATFSCQDCDYTAKLKTDLNSHIKSVHKGIIFPCPDCKYIATQKGSLNRHIQSVHEGGIFPCPDCGYKATQKSNLRTHVNSVHKGAKFPCPDCKYTATWKHNLQIHIKRAHKAHWPKSVDGMNFVDSLKTWYF